VNVPAGTGRVIAVRADAAALPLPDNSADLVVTSPPYWRLRSFSDGGVAYPGQIGGESTPQEYLDRLRACTAEWKRVLKRDGSMFVNLGDSYSDGSSGVPPKGLAGLPWRYALGCTGQLGLPLRAEIIWRKKNSLPEPVSGRVRREHEQPFHFVVQPRCYAAVDEAGRPPAAPGGAEGIARAGQPAGKPPGSVREIASRPLAIPDHVAHAACCAGCRRDGCRSGLAHYALFPPELARRAIAGWSPPGICTVCGQGRAPVSSVTYDRQGRTTNGPRSLARRHESPGRNVRALRMASVAGYACACTQGVLRPSWQAPPAGPAVVLDPCGGTGTTALVASALGRTVITADRSADYCRLAAWRTSDPREMARVLSGTGPRDALPGPASPSRVAGTR
jgi:hypothetical protein